MRKFPVEIAIIIIIVSSSTFKEKYIKDAQKTVWAFQE